MPTTRLSLALALLLPAPAQGVKCTRRVVLSAPMAAFTLASSPALAAQRGAENAYQTQAFEAEVCIARTPLGACAETAKESRAARSGGTAPLRILQPVPEAESELVRTLLKRTEENAEANARLVKEKTIKAGQPGSFGPFASEAPSKADGTCQQSTHAS
jgi:hypothetical protein